MKNTHEHKSDVDRFNELSASYDDHWLEGLLFNAIHKRIVDLARSLPSPPHSIVDIGCGTGRLAARLLAAFPSAAITGIDPSSGMLDVARAAVPGADFVAATAEDLPLTAGSVDLVVTTMSFHHWHDQRQGLSEVARVLREGGTFLLCDQVPGWWTLPFVVLVGTRSRVHSIHELTALVGAAHLNTRESVPVRRTLGAVRIVVARRQ